MITVFYWLTSCSYYKFQAEIGVVTNQDFNTEIVHNKWTSGPAIS